MNDAIKPSLFSVLVTHAPLQVILCTISMAAGFFLILDFLGGNFNPLSAMTQPVVESFGIWPSMLSVAIGVGSFFWALEKSRD